MKGKQTRITSEASTDDGQSGLRKGLMAFAMIEALVLIPVLLYIIFR